MAEKWRSQVRLYYWDFSYAQIETDAGGLYLPNNAFIVLKGLNPATTVVMALGRYTTALPQTICAQVQAAYGGPVGPIIAHNNAEPLYVPWQGNVAQQYYFN